MLAGNKDRVVLVTDDEPCVLRAVAGILKFAGYTVLEADSGEAALRVGRECGGPIDLLLTDVLMPKLSGTALADRFAALHPETRYLFMAGLPDHPEVTAGITGRGRPFLPKPFLPQALLQKVAEVLAGRARSAAQGSG